MPKPLAPLRALATAALVFAAAVPATAQDARPLGPATPPTASDAPDVGPDDEGGRVNQAVVPLPAAGSRVAAADGAGGRGTLLPVAWSRGSAAWHPAWIEPAPEGAFGPARWDAWFAASGLAPALSPHPFLSPWGALAYDDWVHDRYRALWGPKPDASPSSAAADWIRLGDRALAAGEVDRAVSAYRRAALEAPDLPHGWLGLAAALAASGDDAGGAAALREALDRYPTWLPLAVDWTRLFPEPDLEAARAAGDGRARAGGADARLVAGALHLFGGHPEQGRELLAGLDRDPHARILVARGPR